MTINLYDKTLRKLTVSASFSFSFEAMLLSVVDKELDEYDLAKSNTSACSLLYFRYDFINDIRALDSSFVSNWLLIS